MKGQPGLRRIECISELADAALALLQERDNLQAGFVREGVKDLNSPVSSGNSRSSHKGKRIKKSWYVNTPSFPSPHGFGESVFIERWR